MKSFMHEVVGNLQGNVFTGMCAKFPGLYLVRKFIFSPSDTGHACLASLSLVAYACYVIVCIHNEAYVHA